MSFVSVSWHFLYDRLNLFYSTRLMGVVVLTVGLPGSPLTLKRIRQHDPHLCVCLLSFHCLLEHLFMPDQRKQFLHSFPSSAAGSRCYPYGGGWPTDENTEFVLLPPQHPTLRLSRERKTLNECFSGDSQRPILPVYTSTERSWKRACVHSKSSMDKH